MTEDARRPSRPLVLPEPFTGETDYCDWIDHFENVAAVNAWDDDAKLQWLKVRLTGCAQTAFKRLPQATRESYADSLAALKKRFEPESKRELYAAEFQTRRQGKTESWADFTEDLRRLADRAHSDLQEEAREKLSLTSYLDQINDPQVSFGVKQSRPKNLDEAVAATLELESFKNVKPVVKIAQAQLDVVPSESDIDDRRVVGQSDRQFRVNKSEGHRKSFCKLCWLGWITWRAAYQDPEKLANLTIESNDPQGVASLIVKLMEQGATLTSPTDRSQGRSSAGNVVKRAIMLEGVWLKTPASRRETDSPRRHGPGVRGPTNKGPKQSQTELFVILCLPSICLPDQGGSKQHTSQFHSGYWSCCYFT